MKTIILLQVINRLPHCPVVSFFILLASALLPACASRPPMPSDYYSNAGYIPSEGDQPQFIPRAPANYRSTYQNSNITSRQIVPMSDGETAKQPAGTTQTQKTASSETVIKKGKIKQQTSTTEEFIETDTSTVVDTYSVPTADQGARQ